MFTVDVKQQYNHLSICLDLWFSCENNFDKPSGHKFGEFLQAKFESVSSVCEVLDQEHFEILKTSHDNVES